MSNIVAAKPGADAIERVLISGDLAPLTPEQRVTYYKNVCDSVGLNPLTKPFDYLTLNSKLVLYATRACTDQLRKIHGVSLRITARENVEGVYVVTAQATDKTGRIDESTGAVNIGSSKGDNLANALMKAETKAKRRVTLSICGLGMLDETEIETIPNAIKPAMQDVTPANEPPSGLKKISAVVAEPEPQSVEPEQVNVNDLRAAARPWFTKFSKAKNQDAVDALLADPDWVDMSNKLTTHDPETLAKIAVHHIKTGKAA